MSADDLIPKKPETIDADTPKPEDEKKSSPIKKLFVAAAVVVGAIFLAKKFKGKFPNTDEDRFIAG